MQWETQNLVNLTRSKQSCCISREQCNSIARRRKKRSILESLWLQFESKCNNVQLGYIMANMYWTIEARSTFVAPFFSPSLTLSWSLKFLYSSFFFSSLPTLVSCRELGPQDLSGVPLNICNNKIISIHATHTINIAMAGLVPHRRTKMPKLKRKPVCPRLACIGTSASCQSERTQQLKKCSPNQHRYDLSVQWTTIKCFHTTPAGAHNLSRELPRRQRSGLVIIRVNDAWAQINKWGHLLRHISWKMLSTRKARKKKVIEGS